MPLLRREPGEFLKNWQKLCTRVHEILLYLGHLILTILQMSLWFVLTVCCPIATGADAASLIHGPSLATKKNPKISNTQ